MGGDSDISKKSAARLTPMQLDFIHWMILEELQQNGRISFKEIGKKVGLSAPAVIDRIHRMEEHGVIKGYKAIVDPLMAGYTLHVIFFLKTNYNRYEDIIIAELDKIPQVVNHWSVTGETDLIIEAVVPDMNFLARIIEMLTAHGQVTTHFILPNADAIEKPITNFTPKV